MKAANITPGTRKKNHVRVEDAKNYVKWLAALKHRLKNDILTI
ncbi:hypothetical protein [Methanobacterium sp.]|nr:hypothetical protein [Methanobacterium sp.]